MKISKASVYEELIVAVLWMAHIHAAAVFVKLFRLQLCSNAVCCSMRCQRDVEKMRSLDVVWWQEQMFPY